MTSFTIAANIYKFVSGSSLPMNLTTWLSYLFPVELLRVHTQPTYPDEFIIL